MRLQVTGIDRRRATPNLIAGALAFVTALAAALLLADPALAAGTKAGEHIRDVLNDIAKPLLPAIAGVMSIAALIRRDFPMIMLLLAIVFAAGLFIWAPGPLNELVKKIANGIANGA